MSEKAIADIERMPEHIIRKLGGWIDAVSNRGIHEVKKIPGFNDEALKGKLNGKRSIRLNNKYRAIYMVRYDEVVNFLEVIGVSAHDYRK